MSPLLLIAFGKLQVLNLVYLAAAVLFILGLKGLTHPRTAVRGNLMGSVAMLIAVIATLLVFDVVNLAAVVVALIIGAAIGGVFAVKVPMTGMPQMVALFNGFGGIASTLVAGAALLNVEAAVPEEALEALSVHVQLGADFLVATALSGLIGAVTFSGSLVAFAKLLEIMFRKPVHYPGQQAINGLLLLAAILLTAWMATGELSLSSLGWIYLLLVLISLVLGVLLVIPIGGADMPVVIALLNSYSGLAAAATGFVLANSLLIIAGSLVGASGLILTQIMCRAMNRSLANVLFGSMGPSGESATADEVYEGKIKSTTADEVAMLYDGARRAVIVPGYGMAVAQAQHAVRDLYNELEKRGVEVEFAIHPVAGRMPGHMNVLLAEADIPYDKLKDLDQSNAMFAQTDVALVIGANDVVNPLARTDPASPIAEMPILDVDKCRTVVVIKRSLSPGFAGIPNPLFAADNTLMFFADGKQGVLGIVEALHEL